MIVLKNENEETYFDIMIKRKKLLGGGYMVSFWERMPEYNTNITTEIWISILNDKSIANFEIIDVFIKILEIGGEFRLDDLIKKYGKSYSYYHRLISNFGMKIKKKYNFDKYKYDKEYYMISFVGNKRRFGANKRFLDNYYWKIRPELREALMSIDIDLLKNDKKTDIGLNTILYGPPSTGKTYHTVIYAVAIIENEKLDKIQQKEYIDILDRYNTYKEQGLIEFTTFHQSYGYEEFIEGIKPRIANDDIVDENNGDIKYSVESGVFKRFCEKTIEENGGSLFNINSDKNYVFVIDEINRGNISKIFGELITLVEPAKRVGEIEGLTVRLPYSQKSFGIPNNIYLIGTMNTADRSIATIDTALRRRFLFKEMLPQPEVLEDVFVDDISISELLIKINKRISVLYDREHTIGHAYFMPLKDNPNLQTLSNIFKNNIIPLLQEYFYEDYEKIRLVLGDTKKTSPDSQFIIAKINDYIDLFGDVDIDLDDSYSYEINNAAFENIESYRTI